MFEQARLYMSAPPPNGKPLTEPKGGKELNEEKDNRILIIEISPKPENTIQILEDSEE